MLTLKNEYFARNVGLVSVFDQKFEKKILQRKKAQYEADELLKQRYNVLETFILQQFIFGSGVGLRTY